MVGSLFGSGAKEQLIKTTVVVGGGVVFCLSETKNCETICGRGSKTTTKNQGPLTSNYCGGGRVGGWCVLITERE